MRPEDESRVADALLVLLESRAEPEVQRDSLKVLSHHGRRRHYLAIKRFLESHPVTRMTREAGKVTLRKLRHRTD